MESGHDNNEDPGPQLSDVQDADSWQMQAGTSTSAAAADDGSNMDFSSIFQQQQAAATTAASAPPAANTMKLQSSEGQVFEVDLQTAMVSGTLRTMMEDLGDLASDADEVVPLVNVNSATLKKVLQWATYHKDDWLLLAEDDVGAAVGGRQPLSSWDAEFFNVDQATLFQLIVAADYLDIKGLMNAGCRTVASMIRSKTTDEMRKRLCIRNNFTPSEEEMVKKETEWFD
ncbi:S-phase kinase-associated protein 1-like [Amblyomma americanum]